MGHVSKVILFAIICDNISRVDHPKLHCAIGIQVLLVAGNAVIKQVFPDLFPGLVDLVQFEDELHALLGLDGHLMLVCVRHLHLKLLEVGSLPGLHLQCRRVQQFRINLLGLITQDDLGLCSGKVLFSLRVRQRVNGGGHNVVVHLRKLPKGNTPELWYDRDDGPVDVEPALVAVLIDTHQRTVLVYALVAHGILLVHLVPVAGMVEYLSGHVVLEGRPCRLYVLQYPITTLFPWVNEVRWKVCNHLDCTLCDLNNSFTSITFDMSFLATFT